MSDGPEDRKIRSVLVLALAVLLSGSIGAAATAAIMHIITR